MGDSGKNYPVGENIFSRDYNFSAINPFGESFTPTNQTAKTQTNPIKRLNGYDSTILNSTNFNQPEGDEKSVDYRIKDKENTLKDLDAKIKVADNYGTQNEALSLKAKRQRVLQELDTLRKQQLYGGRVLGESKFSPQSFKEEMPIIYKVQEFISKKILSKVSKKINSVVTLSESLEQLAEISKSVDELSEINIPYGEQSQNYEKLTQYLNQANIIHSKISKSMGKKF